MTEARLNTMLTRHRGTGGKTQPGGTNSFEEMVKEMNLYRKCHARFEEEMKSRRQPEDFSSVKATGKWTPAAQPSAANQLAETNSSPS